MLLNRYDPTQIEGPIRDWMNKGFIKPRNLGRKSKIIRKTLTYLPFWVISVNAKSLYKGIFERITPAVVKDGEIQKGYDWLVLARRAAKFPTREYEVPLEGKVPYDFRKIEKFAKILNSEIDKNDAVDLAKRQIEESHRYIAQQNVDKIAEFKSVMKITQTSYLHAPIWFVKYNYKDKRYQLWIDGATGTTIKGEIPSTGFGII
jgi:hypothetical protein